MAIERNESIDKDKLEQLLSINWIQDSEISQDRIKLIAENFSVQDLFPIISKLNKWEAINGVTNDTTNLKMNILYLIDQCHENEKKALNEENLKNMGAQEQKLKDLKDKQEQEKIKNNEKVDTLKQLLFWDDKEAKDKVDRDNVLKATLQAIALNKQNNQTLKDIKDLQGKLKKAIEDNNLEEVAKTKEELEKKKLELKWLLWQKDELYYQYFWEKYDDNNWNWIQEFKHRGKIFGKGKTETWQTVRGVMSPLKPKRIARMRLNCVIRQMNEIWNDSTKWMKMVMNRSYFNWVRPISRWIKDIRNTFRLKNPAEFSAKYDEQANEFIRDLTQKIETAWNLSEEDRKTIALIEKRLKWYKEDYKKQFLQM